MIECREGNDQDRESLHIGRAYRQSVLEYKLNIMLQSELEPCDGFKLLFFWPVPTAVSVSQVVSIAIITGRRYHVIFHCGDRLKAFLARLRTAKWNRFVKSTFPAATETTTMDKIQTSICNSGPLKIFFFSGGGGRRIFFFTLLFRAAIRRRCLGMPRDVLIPRYKKYSSSAVEEEEEYFSSLFYSGA